MKERKLKYKFFNPNPLDKTADYLVKLFIETNMPKVEDVIKEAANKNEDRACHA